MCELTFVAAITADAAGGLHGKTTVCVCPSVVHDPHDAASQDPDWCES